MVESGIAEPGVAPVDHADEPSLAYEQVLGAEIAVRHAWVEAGQRLDLREERLRARALLRVEERKHELLEPRALLGVRSDPVKRGKNVRLHTMERFEEPAHTVATFV